MLFSVLAGVLGKSCGEQRMSGGKAQKSVVEVAGLFLLTGGGEHQ